MKPSDVLRQGWCQRAFAIQESGVTISIHSNSAVAFCALGAIERAYTDDLVKKQSCLARLGAIVGSAIVDWNDAPDRTIEEVISKFQEINE